MNPRIVTLAQLALMPAGTEVSMLKLDDYRHVEFDVQGVVQLDQLERLYQVDSRHVVLKGVRPDVHIREGRVFTYESTRSIARDTEFPFRFVVWPKPAMTWKTLEGAAP